MTLTGPTVTTDAMFTGLRAFLLDVLGTLPVHQGLDNRVAESNQANHVIMQELLRQRIGTNEVSYAVGNPGSRSMLQPTKVSIQLDFYGPASADQCQIVSTAFRDAYACTFLRTYNVAPLYCDDPRLVPFVNGESQYERKWALTVYLQINPAVSGTQTFASTVTVGVFNVDASFPLE